MKQPYFLTIYHGSKSVSFVFFLLFCQLRQLEKEWTGVVASPRSLTGLQLMLI